MMAQETGVPAHAKPGRKLLVAGLAFTTALLVSVALFGYPGVFGNGGTQDGLRVEGHAVAKVYGPSGGLVGVWSGDNVLQAEGRNALASCVSGFSSIPFETGQCTGLTDGLFVDWLCNGSSCPTAASINFIDSSDLQVQCQDPANGGGCGAISVADPVAITPSGCDPSATICATGWNVTALFPSGTFSSKDCGSTCTIDQANAGLVSYYGGLVFGFTQFDQLGPSIAVSPGDSLSLTITFTVS